MFSEMIFRSNSYARIILFSDGFKNVFSTFSGGIQYTFSMFSVYHFLTKTRSYQNIFRKVYLVVGGDLRQPSPVISESHEL